MGGQGYGVPRRTGGDPGPLVRGGFYGLRTWGEKGFFHLGHKNVTSNVSKLIKRGAGPALDLRVGSGPPMKVNSSEKVASLNSDQIDGKDESAFLGKTEKAADSDKLDGKDSTEIGVNGLEIVEKSSVYNSAGLKSATAQCPSGKRVVGGGARYSSSQTGLGRSDNHEIVIQGSRPFSNLWPAQADWMGGSGNAPFNWRLIAYAICAEAP